MKYPLTQGTAVFFGAVMVCKVVTQAFEALEVLAAVLMRGERREEWEGRGRKKERRGRRERGGAKEEEEGEVERRKERRERREEEQRRKRKERGKGNKERKKEEEECKDTNPASPSS